MSQEKMLEALIQLGLRKTEARIYFYISKRGPKQAHEIIEALNMKKQQLYPSLKGLQNKAIIKSSLDRPAKFSAIPFEKVLDLLAKAKMEEAKSIQQNKKMILSDWQSINLPSLKDTSVFFNVIKGKKYVFSKIQQMIQESESEFSVISDLSDIIRSEQFGVLDTIQNHPQKFEIKFRVLTDVPEQHLLAAKKLSENINSQIELRGLNTNIGTSLVPRMAIKDDKEILYFVSEKNGKLGTQNEYSCLFTNCSSIVKPLSNVFEELWQNSTNIKQKIQEIETGTLPENTLIIKDVAQARAKYREILKRAKKEILIVTSTERLKDFQEILPAINNLAIQNPSIKIMSPITKDNLDIANSLLPYSQVKHIPKGYIDTIVVDDAHLFQFDNLTSIAKETVSKHNYTNTLYTNNPEYVTKTNNMLENVWNNSSEISKFPVESVFDPLTSFSLSSKSASNDPSSEVIHDHLKTKPVISKTSPGEVTEKEVISKIIDLNQPTAVPRKIIKCYCKLGYAAINPLSHFNLPKMLITTCQIDKKSSFGAEDRLVFHLWQKTQKGFEYVPVAIVGDNPNFPIETLDKGQYANTPAAKNFRLVKREAIQFQFYGNKLLASWTIPVPISDTLTLAPGTILLETYGNVKTKRVVLNYPNGAYYNIFYNGFDAFVTYLHESSKYMGPGTDGLFLRDAFIEISLP